MPHFAPECIFSCAIYAHAHALANMHARTYALLVECDSGHTLGGSCERDVINMSAELVQQGIAPTNIWTLFTSTNHPSHVGVNNAHSSQIFAIARNIMQRSPSLFVVLITGHGYSIADTGACGDEIDGMDEAIVVGSGPGSGFITDDQIYEQIVTQLQCPAILFADTCHSGTMFDLPLMFNGFGWSRATRRADAVMAPIMSLSACADSQLSMCDIGSRTGFGGSLTVALLNVPDAFVRLLERRDIIGAYRAICAQVNALGQTCILSATETFISRSFGAKK